MSAVGHLLGVQSWYRSEEGAERPEVFEGVPLPFRAARDISAVISTRGRVPVSRVCNVYRNRYGARGGTLTTTSIGTGFNSRANSLPGRFLAEHWSYALCLFGKIEF
jgi:hypothetical protein